MLAPGEGNGQIGTKEQSGIGWGKCRTDVGLGKPAKEEVWSDGVVRASDILVSGEFYAVRRTPMKAVSQRRGIS